MSGILELDPRNKHRPACGRLLVSVPYLPDPYFRRTVVLLCGHDEEGSFGFVLNRPMDIPVNDLVKDVPPLQGQVSIGGPVQSDNLFYLHTLGPHVQGSIPVVDGVYLGGDFDQLRAMLRTDPRLGRHVRFFVGYAGWSANQLDRELEERAWWVSRADRRRIMRTRADDLWSDTLRGMGREYAPLANFPEDPALN